MQNHRHEHHAQGHSTSSATGGTAGHREHHAMMAADFRRRFWISLLLTLPVLALAPMIQEWLGLKGRGLMQPRAGRE